MSPLHHHLRAAGRPLLFLLLLSLSLLAPAQTSPAPAPATPILECSDPSRTILDTRQAILDGNFDIAATAFIKTPSAEQLLSLLPVLNRTITRSLPIVYEGSTLAECNINGSHIYLLKVDSRWLFTEATTANIDQLKIAANRLDSPAKAIALFQSAVAAKDYHQALQCFVTTVNGTQKNLDTQDSTLRTAFKNFANYIGEVGLLNNTPEKQANVLVTYKTPRLNISLVQEGGDWLFTTRTLENVQVTFTVPQDAALLEPYLPSTWTQSAFLLKNWQWLAIALIFIIGFLIRITVNLFIRRIFLRQLIREGKSDTKHSHQALTYLGMLLAWYFLVPYIGLNVKLTEHLRNLCLLGSLFAGTVFALRIIHLIRDMLMVRAAKTDNKIDDVLVPMGHNVGRVIIILICIALTLAKLGFNITGLLAGLGIGGLAFALAAKDTVENIFGSVSILLDTPFEVGDVIKIGDVVGSVEAIGLRSTKIRTPDKSLVNVPNANLIRANVDNLGKRPVRRINTTIGLTYDSSPEKIEAFCEGIRELIRQHPYTLKTDYRVAFTNFGSYSLDIIVQALLNTTDYNIELRERQRLFLDIIRLANRMGLAFAFPTTSIIQTPPETLAPPELQTSPQAISASYEAARQAARQVAADSGATLHLQIPSHINFTTGTPYLDSASQLRD